DNGGVLGDGQLTGTADVAAVNGIATFANLRIDQIGRGYTLTATASPLAADTSDAFDITATPPPAPGPATKLAFAVQPTNTAPGVLSRTCPRARGPACGAATRPTRRRPPRALSPRPPPAPGAAAAPPRAVDPRRRTRGARRPPRRWPRRPTSRRPSSTHGASCRPSFASRRCCEARRSRSCISPGTAIAP